MKKILILGGTRFIGRNLTLRLKEENQLTIVGRSNKADFIDESVEYLKADRHNTESLSKALKDKSWDIIFDNICYSAKQAKVLVDSLKNLPKKFIMISTRSVYSGEGPFVEEDFNPFSYSYDLNANIAVPLEKPKINEISYGEGKRQAEAYFAEKFGDIATFVRFPIVFGEEDYTKRLHNHFEAAITENPIYFAKNLDALQSYIYVNDAVKVLEFLSKSDFHGPINAASNPISIKELIHWISLAANNKLIIANNLNEGEQSSLTTELDSSLNTSKLSELGVEMRNIKKVICELFL